MALKPYVLTTKQTSFTKKIDKAIQNKNEIQFSDFDSIWIASGKLDHKTDSNEIKARIHFINIRQYQVSQADKILEHF